MSSQRLTLLLSGAVVLGSWLVCGLSYASVPPEQSGTIGLFVILAGMLTLVAARFVVGGWLGELHASAAFATSVLAAAAILWVALLLQLADH